MSSTEEFKVRLRDASDDELRGMYLRLPDFNQARQGYIARAMQVRGLLAEDIHREREVQHMETVERQGRWQTILGFSVLGVQLIPMGGAFSVGFVLGLALGTCSGDV